jgi:hypothetical protein
MSKHSEQVAFDAGEGHRCITHDRTNRYDPITEPDEHAAWERGWEKMDRALS